MIDRDKALDLYRRARAAYFGPVTALCGHCRDLAELSAQAPVPGLWSPDRAALVAKLLNDYNVIGRVLSRADLEAYPISLTADGADITISAPPGTSADEIAANTLGVLWVPIVAGIALITGALAAITIMRSRAAAQLRDLADQLNAADVEALKADPATRAVWSNWKNQNAAQLKQIADSNPGLIDRLVAGGSALGKLALVAAGIYLAAKLISSNPRREENPCR